MADSRPGRQRTVAIVQARLGSTRLPGKVMKPLAGRTVLDHVIARCRAIPSVDAVVIATTTLDADRTIAEAAIRSGALVHRGSPEDVLQRYAEAAAAAEAEVILRVTSDCPLIDPGICDRTIRLRDSAGADYASNNMPRLFPHGLDCEVFTRAALERADRDAVSTHDREHVTPWLRRDASVSRTSLIGPGWPSVLQRWTLDYPEDYDFLAALFPLLPNDRILSSESVLALLGARPDIAAINAHRRAGGPRARSGAAPVAVFRFEADQATGIGHAMRSNAFASLLEPLGWNCFWAVSASTAGFLAGSAPPGGLIVLDNDAPALQAAQILEACGGCDLLIVDHHDAGSGLEAALRKTGARVLRCDDLAEHDTDADLVLNPAPTIGPAAYSGKARSDARLLLGPSFAMLRSQFPASRRHSLARIARVRKPARVMVAFGGTDPLNGTGLALEVLADSDVERVDVMLTSQAVHLADVGRQIASLGARGNLLVDIAEVAEALSACDLVIGAPGSGNWERACLGLPSLLVGIVENQRANAASMAESGAALVSGFLPTDDRETVAQRLRRDLDLVRHDLTRYQEMHQAALRLCDGRGTMRLAALLTRGTSLKDGAELTVRLAEQSDARMLYDWQQAPETRKYALDRQPFSFAQHEAWLERKLGSERDFLLIGEAGGEACGFVRLDWFGADRDRPQYLISIAAAPGQYRRGVGRALLQSARRLAPGAHLYAKVVEANQASLALFRNCGYQLREDGYYHSTKDVEAGSS